MKTPIDKIDKEDRIFGYWFPYYKKYIPHRIKVLKLALKDLMYYLFFYEINNGRRLIGKNKILDILL